MTTIQIARNVSPEAIARVQTMLDQTAAHDVNWNGANFRIERDEFTCIADDDSLNAASLLADVQRAIQG